MNERLHWSKHRHEMEEELAVDPIVQRTGRVSGAALKRASKAVHRRFEHSGMYLVERINSLLRKDRDLVLEKLEDIENSLPEFTPEELKIVGVISKALAQLSERAKDWSERLSQGDVVDGEGHTNPHLLLSKETKANEQPTFQ